MYVIFLLIALSLLVAVGFLIAFFWAAKHGQFDDTFTPSVRMLFDDSKPINENKTNDTHRSES